METRIKALLSIAVVSVMILSGTKSHAMVLQGYLKEDRAVSQTDMLNSAASQCTAGGAISQNAQVDTTMPNSFPASYQGMWRCVSYVTDSQVASVPVGNETVSEISFVRNDVGQVVAKWQQPGWTETQATIAVPAPNQANLDRTNFFYGQDTQGTWAARSRDRFAQTSNNEMVALSYIDQYVDGQYVGRYHTKSVLVRIDHAANTNHLAFGGN